MIIVIIIVMIARDARLIKQYVESKKIVKLASSIAVSACVVLLVLFSVAFLKDIPNVINKNYNVVTGTVVSGNRGGKNSETRGITLETDDGERIQVTVNYTPIELGERYEIIRLPNTSYGNVIRKIEDDWVKIGATITNSICVVKMSENKKATQLLADLRFSLYNPAKQYTLNLAK